MSVPYTCITCHVAFRDLEIQRQHYKSDWHRYNLKRKVADLPPITAEDFQKKVIAQRNKDNELQELQNMSCKICRKNFSTKNQYDNHLLSKKHKENVSKHSDKQDELMQLSESVDLPEPSTPSTTEDVNKAAASTNKRSFEDMETESDVESVDSDEWIEDTDNPAKNNDCLFCNHHSRSLIRNLKHMTVAHSFFIPDPEYCTDVKGLLVYLGEKIYAGYMCIWCNDRGKGFQSADAAKAHMIDKGHCKMLHEGDALLEYTEFYDYSSSYPDAGTVDPDTEVEIPQLDDSDYQLVLPSGAVIGHRSLMRYYKQNLNPNRTIVQKNDKLRKVLSQYRALGWNGTNREIVTKKIADIKYMQRVQTKYATQLQFKANKLQKHFRPQVNF